MSFPEIIESLKLLKALEVAKPLIIIFVIWSAGFIKFKGERLWTRLLKKIGEDINWKVLDRVKAVDEKFSKRMDSFEKQFKEHIEDSELEKILNYRQKIIRFADEIYQGRNHSREHYDEVRGYIDIYDDYCKDHPKFPNSKALSSIKMINETYDEKTKNHTFLDVDKQ